MWRNSIKRLRQKRGLIVKEMSEATGINPTTINIWERSQGTRIPEKHQALLSDFFGVPIEEIFWDEKEDLLELDIKEWQQAPQETMCRNCSSFIWDGEEDSCGRCRHEAGKHMPNDVCVHTERFASIYSSVSCKGAFSRPQIKAYCGNCIHCRIRKGMYRCINAMSSFYCLAVAHSAVCPFCSDASGSILPA